MPPQVLFPCSSSSQESEIPQSRSFVQASSALLLQRLPLSQSSPVCTSPSPHPSSSQTLLQPSLLSSFPSSHCSCGTSRSPLPHTVTTTSSAAGTVSSSPSHGERNSRLHPPITRPVVALISGMEQALRPQTGSSNCGMPFSTETLGGSHSSNISGETSPSPQ